MKNETWRQRIWRRIRFTKDIEKINPNVQYDYVNNVNITEGVFIPGKCRFCGTRRKV